MQDNENANPRNGMYRYLYAVFLLIIKRIPLCKAIAVLGKLERPEDLFALRHDINLKLINIGRRVNLSRRRSIRSIHAFGKASKGVYIPGHEDDRKHDEKGQELGQTIILDCRQLAHGCSNRHSVYASGQTLRDHKQKFISHQQHYIWVTKSHFGKNTARLVQFSFLA